MAFIFWILIALSLQALAGATKVTYSINITSGKIYAETDEKHYAMYGQVKDKDGVRIESASEDGQYYLTSKCESSWTDIKKIDEHTLSSYHQIRENFLALTKGPEESPDFYIWSDEFSNNQRGFSAVRLDPQTVVYGSQYFPSVLARVIISGQLAAFVHYDGNVRMKTLYCLCENEKIFIDGLKRINVNGKNSMFAFAGDKVLKKHLENNSFREFTFRLERKHWSDEEIHLVTALGRKS